MTLKTFHFAHGTRNGMPFVSLSQLNCFLRSSQNLQILTKRLLGCMMIIMAMVAMNGKWDKIDSVDIQWTFGVPFFFFFAQMKSSLSDFRSSKFKAISWKESRITDFLNVEWYEWHKCYYLCPISHYSFVGWSHSHQIEKCTREFS